MTTTSFSTTENAAPTNAAPKGRILTGRIISWICILFLLFDAITKIMRERHTIEACNHLGWPPETMQPLGIVLLICTILYALPRTAVPGAILLTAWLGGATAVNLRVGFPLWFSIIFGILIWLGLWLRDPRLSAHLPVKKY